jgi:hypothetical protein
VCAACGAGNYSSEAGASACERCAGGAYVSTAGATTCVLCAAGTHSPAVGATNASTCVACPLRGAWAPGAGASTCAIAPGFYDAASASAGIHWRFAYAGVDVARGRWLNSSGNGVVGTMGHAGPSASGLSAGCASGNGATVPVCALSGRFVTQRTDVDFVDFRAGTLPGTWTMCALARYTDTSQSARAQRILTAAPVFSTANIIFGHAGGLTCNLYLNAGPEALRGTSAP